MKEKKFYFSRPDMNIAWWIGKFSKSILEDYALEEKIIEGKVDSSKHKLTFISIKRLNFYIGKNNSGKSRFLRGLFAADMLAWSYNNGSDINFLGNKEGYPIMPKKGETAGEILNSIYIPVLRGLRPLPSNEEKNVYLKRTITDYFQNKITSDNVTIDPGNPNIFRQTIKTEHDNKTVIIKKTIYTGENFLEDIEEFKQKKDSRDFLSEWQKILNKYFFSNVSEISIEIEKETDVISLKIGNVERSIYDLGDGLQQIIILTYQAIKNKDKSLLFFIEEPELYLHPGMLRQLIEFYLNETKHYYFFTTHSNHLLDMIVESDDVIIKKFIKQDNNNKPFKICSCGQDKELLKLLGVRPSSVYLANCTIWVEGITDRLYILKYMEKYLQKLSDSDKKKYEKYSKFIPNYHYSFVEYSGNNITHWNFDDDEISLFEDKGMSAKQVMGTMFVVSDGDIENKKDRLDYLKNSLKENFFVLEGYKEIENTLPSKSIKEVARKRFDNMRDKENKKLFNIEKLNKIDDGFFKDSKYGIGKLLDDKLRKGKGNETLFSDGTEAGTLKRKLDFCHNIIDSLDKTSDWDLTDEIKNLCEKIFEHIENCNNTPQEMDRL